MNSSGLVIVLQLIKTLNITNLKLKKMRTTKLLSGLLLAAMLFVATFLNAQTARLQVIHNSADAAAAVVDVWANSSKLLENFAFRTATPFIDVPAGTPITLSITGPGSTSPMPNVYQATVTFEAAKTYVVVANGIVSVSGYTPATPFNLYVNDMGRENASMTGNTDVLAFHGSTDAPTVSVWETGVGAGQLFTFSYGDFAGYLELATNDYILEIRDETGTTTVAAYQAPLAALGLQGQALSVVASGFLNPMQNSNGAAFGLYVALASGGALIPLPLFPPTGIESISSSGNMMVYPNPAREYVSFNSTRNGSERISLEIINMVGKTIRTIDLGSQDQISNYRIDTSAMPAGIYFLKVNSGGKSYIEKLVISR